jgi:hypothetical protein
MHKLRERAIGRFEGRKWWCLWASCLCLCIVGCNIEEPIETVTVPLSRSGLPIKEATQERMVVAVALQPDASWFFKISGSTRALAEAESAWVDFLKQVSFDDQGQPVWQVPTGWRAISAVSDSPMSSRLATLVIPNSFRDKVELVVSSLGPDFDRLANFNRWRGQMGLEPITANELDEEIGELEYRGGKFLVFDRSGEIQGGMMPPGMGAGGQAAMSAPVQKELDYQLPSGWTVNTTATFVTLRLEKTSGEQLATISVTALPEKMVTWEESIENWIAESGVSLSVAEAIEVHASTETVAGVEAKRMDLQGAGERPRSVSAVMFVSDGAAWFVKMSGPPELVASSQEEFAKFLASLRFK